MRTINIKEVVGNKFYFYVLLIVRKLVLHSDQIKDYKEVDLAFIKLLDKKSPRLAYIPSRSDFSRKYFKEKVDWYKQFGITDLFYFDVDQEYDKGKVDELVACDAIFLSGGNTCYFLKSLKKRKFLPILREYVRNGGVLIGVSAGSIIMSKTINITAIFNKDTFGLKDFTLLRPYGASEGFTRRSNWRSTGFSPCRFTALGLVDFEFFPHLNHNKENFLEDLKKYSIKRQSVIYACGDGDGIVVDNDKIRFLGDILKIQKGKVSSV